MELAHVIVSMIDTRPAKVMCKTCKGQHNFKRMGGATSPRASGTGTRKAATPRVTVKAADYWEEKMAEHSAAPIVPYSPKQSFAKGDVLKHTQFGMGIVQEVRFGGKILVLFREGDKILVHGLGPPAPAA
jgi:hypothetical protein